MKYKFNWTLEKAVFEGASLKATFRAISASLIKAAISDDYLLFNRCSRYWLGNNGQIIKVICLDGLKSLTILLIICLFLRYYFPLVVLVLEPLLHRLDEVVQF